MIVDRKEKARLWAEKQEDLSFDRKSRIASLRRSLTAAMRNSDKDKVKEIEKELEDCKVNDASGAPQKTGKCKLDPDDQKTFEEKDLEKSK